jgi:hypothetical protein
LSYLWHIAPGQGPIVLEKASAWWIKQIKKLDAQVADQCHVCNEIRGDLSEVTCHRKDPDDVTKAKNKKRRTLTEKYEAHR